MDPLAQLKDIHLPANVHSYPIAPGWWLLALVILTLVIYGALKLRQYIVKRKAQKKALKQLSTTTEVSAIVSLLKWAAIQYFPRAQVAALTGESFKAFLIATLPQKQQQNFTELSDQHFTSVYQNDAASQMSDDFSAAAKIWLSYALPPKAVLPSFTTSENTSTAGTNKVVKNLEENNGVQA